MRNIVNLTEFAGEDSSDGQRRVVDRHEPKMNLFHQI